ncbi:sulfatase [Nocardioides fonticola]|uniref:Sulfatase n=1 Tax=Nocardioides fonticola TaxID=450363 RepID=A0ABP7XZE0_9ACTN
MSAGWFRWALDSPRVRRTLAGGLAAVGVASVTTGLAASGTSAGLAPAGVSDAVSAASPFGSGSRPNVVVVMVDDMRADDLRFAPTIRHLADTEGVTFQNSFSPYPLCAPSRASFLTGEYAHNHGVLWHHRPYGYAAFDDSRTLATSLRDAGYHTGLVGKYENGYGGMPSKVTGRSSLHYVPNGWDEWRASLTAPPGAGVDGDTYNFMDIALSHNGRIQDDRDGQYSTDVIGAQARDVVGEFSRSRKPFFLDVAFVAPHAGGPRDPEDPGITADPSRGRYRMPTTYVAKKYRGRFDAEIERGAGLPADGGPAEADVSDKPYFFREQDEPTTAQRAALRTATVQRANAIGAVDQQVGRLVKRLRDLGEWKNTVLVFTSDNGYFLGEHRQLDGKVHGHEPALRVPMVITGPGFRDGAHGRERFDPISTVDLSATVLDLAGAQPPRRADGTSKVTTLLEGDQGWSTGIVTESLVHRKGRRAGFDNARGAIGVRTARYSMMLYRTGASELYDLAKDPREQTNLWKDPAYRSVRRDLEQVWWQLHDCRGAECRTPLPASLAASPEEEADLGHTYWRRIESDYSYRNLPR